MFYVSKIWNKAAGRVQLHWNNPTWFTRSTDNFRREIFLFFIPCWYFSPTCCLWKDECFKMQQGSILSWIFKKIIIFVAGSCLQLKRERESVISIHDVVYFVTFPSRRRFFNFLFNLKTQRQMESFDSKHIHRKVGVLCAFLGQLLFSQSTTKYTYMLSNKQFSTSTGYSWKASSQEPVKRKGNSSKQVLTLTSAKHLFHYVRLCRLVSSVLQR